MKNRITIVIFLLAGTLTLSAQHFEAVMQDIERNNTTLAALQAQTEATRWDSKTGLAPDNPEVEFGYLWGNPADMGNRVDLNVTQSFDFPTTYAYRKKVADSHVSQATANYQAARRDILLQAEKSCINLIYYNIMQREYARHQAVAQAVLDAYQKMYDQGEKSILDLNKAKLDLLSVRRDVENNRIERDAVLAELVRLNGGKPVVLEDTIYPNYILPEDFNHWYAQAESSNSLLKTYEAAIQTSESQVQLSKSLWAPKLSVGYNSERILGTTLQGVGVGVSLPLWQNSRAVKSAQLNAFAQRCAEQDARLTLSNEMKSKYAQAQSLQRLYGEYMEILQGINSEALLKRALDEGEIPMVEYIMEKNVYREAVHEAFTTHRDLMLAVCELMYVER